MTIALEVANLRKSFGTSEVLQDVSLHCSTREKFCLLGKSGSGKTTLLRIIAGLERPDHGQVLINGKPLNTFDRRNWPVALAFQKPAIYPHLSVWENLAFPLQARAIANAKVKARVDLVASLVGVQDLLSRSARNLSGGETQRVALGKSIAVAPSVLLLDEPLSSVDPSHKWELLRILRRVYDVENTCMVLVTHDISEARFFGDKIAVLANGMCSDPFNPNLDIIDCSSIAVLRALSHPPANEIVLSRSSSDKAIYQCEGVALQIKANVETKEIIVAFSIEDAVITAQRPDDLQHIAIFAIKEQKQVGAISAGYLIEISPGNTPLILALQNSELVNNERSAWLSIKRSRIVVFNNSTGQRILDWQTSKESY